MNELMRNWDWIVWYYLFFFVLSFVLDAILDGHPRPQVDFKKSVFIGLPLCVPVLGRMIGAW